MPLTYHFRPFPKPGEPLLSLQPLQKRPGPTSVQCSCQDTTRCRQCRRPERDENSTSNRSSQTVLPSIKEEADPVPRSITPKAIRDQRRAARSLSVSAAFNEAVGDEDYFTFFHPTAFERSRSTSSGSSRRERSSRRLGSASSSTSRKSSTEQLLPTIPDLAPADSEESPAEEDRSITRRDS